MENISSCGDDAFGPQVKHCRGGFDFTLFFEECFFSIVPSALLLLALPLRYNQLRQSRIRKVARSWLYWAKLIFGQAFGVIQLSLLVVWFLPHAPRTRASLAAAGLAFFSSVGLLFLSHWEHVFSVYPSNILNIALSVSLLFDVVRVRSLWLASNTAIAGLYTASIILKMIWFYLESQSKRTYFLNQREHHGEEEVHGLYNRTFFWWVNSYLCLGFKRILSVDDLPHLDQTISSEILHRQLIRRCTQVMKASRTSRSALAYSTIWTFKSSIIWASIARLAVIGLTYCQPFLITALTDYVQNVNPSKNDGYGLIGGFALVFFLKGSLIQFAQAFSCLYQHHNFRLTTKIRGALVSLIFEKTLTLAFDEISDAAALTLMSNDIDNIAFGVQNMHEIWASPVETGIALFLLQRQVSWAAAVPAFVSVVTFVSTHFLSKSTPSRQKSWMQAVRQRVAFASSYLNNSATIKMLGIQDSLSSILQQFRIKELSRQKKFRHMMIKMNLLAGTITNLCPVLTLGIYTGIALHTGSSPLTASSAFTTLSIVSLLSSPLSNLIYSGPKVTGALECFQRIQEYLMAESKLDDRIISHPQHSMAASQVEESELEAFLELQAMNVSALGPEIIDLVHIYQAAFGWQRQEAAILSDVNIKIPPSSLTLLVGHVGSGKSTLLKAILGEVPCLKGFIHVNITEISFCDTKTWIRNRSIRDNICHPLPYDEQWYRTVISSTTLDRDIDALPQKDHTVIGSNGLSMSGGQRQRIAIARAAYARTKLAIFDDSLSALDTATSALVFTRVFGSQGILRQNGTAVILATHDWNFLTDADNVIILGDGKIREQGPPRELKTFKARELEVSTESSVPFQGLSQGIQVNTPFTNITELNEKFARKQGDLRDYAYYFRASGGWSMILYAGALTIGVFCAQFTNLWVQWWADENLRTPFGQFSQYISVYAILATAGAGIWAFCMWLVFCRIVPTSSSKIHEFLVNKVKKAPLHWFTATDSGVILNRFSQDMTLVDRSLPAEFLKTSSNFIQCLMSATFICVGAKLMAPLILLTVFAIYWIQKFYLRTSRQLRFLDLEYKSPLFTQFTETLDGLITIRAFGWQHSFQEEHKHLLLQSQKPYYFLFVVQRWLTLVLDLLVAGIAVMLAILSVFTPDIGPVGVSLISLITFNQQLAELINFWTLMETSIGAITRVRTFEKVPTEDLPLENQYPPVTWPLEGSIIFQDTSMAYELTAHPVLRNIALNIPAGSKLGICGRTGSGKSSLILALLRMIEIQSGDIIIDGISLQSCPRDMIRSKITVIPQEPVLFPGTIRENIGAFKSLDDHRALRALEKVELKGHVMEYGGLDAKMDDLPLSAGQRQLICLARAIVMKQNILLLDEVTSHVDDTTDRLMQQVIRQEFSGCTIVAVAHRAHTLLDFDRIAVIDDGKVIEYDTPAALLSTAGPLFSRLCDLRRSIQ
ncbi:hypothetical protein N7494_007693 [Penicillium frequentans]|uniref:Uncharacterized protein n=1 Tax=Penicillium frequentans TaxID=3151616 RepID=A0AAD6GEF9_9EURO|nr:hypothetical protein N7494_007693 [Penicillium glabrum]